MIIPAYGRVTISCNINAKLKWHGLIIRTTESRPKLVTDLPSILKTLSKTADEKRSALTRQSRWFLNDHLYFIPQQPPAVQLCKTRKAPASANGSSAASGKACQFLLRTRGIHFQVKYNLARWYEQMAPFLSSPKSQPCQLISSRSSASGGTPRESCGREHETLGRERIPSCFCSVNLSVMIYDADTLLNG